jgi:RimJ/RimL family protein N-acetyltransferase
MKVELRKYKISDLDRICELFINDNVIKNLAFPKRAAEIKTKDEKDWLSETISNYKKKKPKQYSLAIIYNEEYVGSIGCPNIDYENEKAEIGYWIGEQYWGKGITTKAVKKFISHLYEKWGFRRLEALTYVQNKKSRRVLEKTGFKLEGINKKAIKKGGKFVDRTTYALVR